MHRDLVSIPTWTVRFGKHTDRPSREGMQQFSSRRMGKELLLPLHSPVEVPRSLEAMHPRLQPPQLLPRLAATRGVRVPLEQALVNPVSIREVGVLGRELGGVVCRQGTTGRC